MLLFLTSL